MSVGPAEIMVVLIVALVVLGPEKLPGAARQAGRAYAELKKLSHGVQTQIDQALKLEEERTENEHNAQESDQPRPSRPHDTEGFRLIDGGGATNEAGSDKADHPSRSPFDEQRKEDQ